MATTSCSRVEQMVEWFSLEGLNKGAARFDFVKLENVNGHYIRERHARSGSTT